METPEKMPEWDVFERIEKLEKLEPTTKDAYVLAQFAFLRGFAVTAQRSSNIRKQKDNCMASLRKLGLSDKTAETVEKWLLHICEVFEKHG